MLIDLQFSLSEAQKLAAQILETGKHLATIDSTHAHPDQGPSAVEREQNGAAAVLESTGVLGSVKVRF